MTVDELLDRYSTGPELLEVLLGRALDEQLDLTPGPGAWSIREVICHVADVEIIYADRMKRVIVEDNPLLAAMDPDLFARRLPARVREISTELALIAGIRQHMMSVLKGCDLEDFQRTGVHTEDGPLTLETLLERITGHIPHHARFIEDKLSALATA